MVQAQCVNCPYEGDDFEEKKDVSGYLVDSDGDKQAKEMTTILICPECGHEREV